MSAKTGILLVNLGTPQSYRPKDVFHYLNEFLTDGRVIDLSWLKRQLLVRGIIVPSRFRASAKLYKKLWTDEGSPLLVHGRDVEKQLQQSLGDQFKVVLAMRYKFPSIEEGLNRLHDANVEEILILPLFPQYASATTGSVHQKVMEVVKQWNVIPKMVFVNSYATQPDLVQAFCIRGRQYSIDSYDHILFSFHGLPNRHLLKADKSQHCLKQGCCDNVCKKNSFCYKAQCYATARAIAEKLEIPKAKYTVCFQSRLGKDPWVQPYTSDLVEKCAKENQKRVLVFCPAFVSDCLETTLEISHEYADEFKKFGGEELQLVEGLNGHPVWVEALKNIVFEHVS